MLNHGFGNVVSVTFQNHRFRINHIKFFIRRVYKCHIMEELLEELKV